MPIFQVSLPPPTDDEGHVVGDPSHSLATLGPTIPILVERPDDVTSGEGDSKRRVFEVHALIDTGASKSCIDTSFAEELGLPQSTFSKSAASPGSPSMSSIWASSSSRNLKSRYGRAG